MNYKIIAILTALLGLGFGYWLQGRMNTPFKRKRAWRNLKCFFGFHAPSPVRMVTRREAIQECDWCGKAIRLYDIDKHGTYRRVR